MITLRSLLAIIAVAYLINWQWESGKRLYAVLWYFLASKFLMKNP